jgi:IS4 transposase
MFRISRIQELMKQIPRGEFDRSVERHQADKYSKRFGSWDQLTAMVYAQLSDAQSLRQIQAGFNAQRTHHYHLGTHELKRSTLADANASRTPQVFADLASSLMSKVKGQLRRSCKELLYLLDSTSITLKGRGFDEWTHAQQTRHTQGVKLHMLYESNAQAPCWHSITPANVNDRNEAVRLPIESGAVYVFDKAYCDYTWWHGIDCQGARFVTRFKRNAALLVVQERTIVPSPPEMAHIILKDEIVRFSHKHPGAKRRNPYNQQLRRVTVAREANTPLVLATNDLDAPAAQIAQLYKERWQVELFFKWIKQHLRIKRFFGQTENAVRIQILTALITHLLRTLYKQTHHIAASLWNLLGELRATLFQRPSLEAQRYHQRRQRLHEFNAVQPGLFS